MRRLFATAAFIAFALPTAAFAQSQSGAALVPTPVPAAITAAPSVTAPAPSAMVRADVAGIQRRDDAADAHALNTAAAGGLHQGQGMALMVVGGAAMLGGLIIGDGAGDAIAIGGLAVGLIGLYQYVR
jgi:hypothetical protein